MAQPAFSDLIVAIPGILGSRLVRRQGDRHVTVWNFSIRDLWSLLRTLAADGIVLSGDGIHPPNDGIEAVDLFDFQLLPGFFGIDDYVSLVNDLERSVGAQQVIKFPYDWRLSNRHAALRLETSALDALRRWRKESNNAQAKLWLVCHSMGGLVARYFCEVLGGASETRAVITIGTPHRGSVRALDALVNGKRFGPIDMTRLVRSLPSVYELLPLFPVLRQGQAGTTKLLRVADLFGLDPVTGNDVPGWSDPTQQGQPSQLPGIDRAMLKRALEFHAAIRNPAESRAETGEAPLYRLEAFFNRRQPTALSARLDGKGLKLLDTYPELHDGVWVEEDFRGDGTVPSFSSVPIEWADTERAIAVGEKHAQLQAGVALRDTIFNWMHPLDVRAKKGVLDAEVVALDVPSICTEGEDVTVTTAAQRPTSGFVELLHVDSKATFTEPVRLTAGDTPRKSVFRRLPLGVHRVTFRPADKRQPSISDYVFVVDK
jgi:hypothetical protein